MRLSVMLYASFERKNVPVRKRLLPTMISHISYYCYKILVVDA